MIRQSNVSWSEEEFHKMIEVAQAHPKNPGLIPRGPIDALVTDHTCATAPVLEDWGPELGRCEVMRGPCLGREIPRGEITLLPRWSNGQVDVMFAGEAVVMARLKNNGHMNAMASCQFVMNDSIASIKKGKTYQDYNKRAITYLNLCPTWIIKHYMDSSCEEGLDVYFNISRAYKGTGK